MFSCDVLACSIHCIQEGHLVKNLPSPGWEKLLNGVEESGVRGKENRHHSRMGARLWTSFSDGCQAVDIILGWVPGCDCTGNSGMPHCCMSSHILASGLPPVLFLPLAPVFGADLLKSHECTFHTRSAQRSPLLLYIYGQPNLNTWVCFLDGNQL